MIDSVIRLRSTNFVERPWGGLRMLDYKGCVPLPDQKKITGMGIGEAFETAACPTDEESNAYPSIAELADNTTISLPDLLAKQGLGVLGPELFSQYGPQIPLLPKTLDIAELLSVQAHPPGNTELYVIIEAEPGASIRLGFKEPVDADLLRRRLEQGLADQQALAKKLQPDTDLHAFNNALAAELAQRTFNEFEVAERLADWFTGPVETLLRNLHDVYWYVLNLMNEIAVTPGQVIYNASPSRADLDEPSAEVHALGNPQGREILMLEIRRPGVTFRAWDNVRFPVRETDIEKTLKALHLGPTTAEDFAIKPQPLADQPGISQLVRSARFAVDELRPCAGTDIVLPGGRFETLHVLDGEISVNHGGKAVRLRRGESAIVPAVLGQGLVCSDNAQVIRAWLPESA